MAIKKEKKQEEATNYEVEVTRAHEFKSGDISFDMIVNGVSVYSCTYVNENPDKGIKSPFVSFPARKGSDGKYYNLAWFKVSDELFSDIEKQIEALI